ncbi:MAG: TetR family transcriptional regulator [Actinomycetaceae bacterium]|nr:TetR family transcriptional regulator [Arcanobacterium sp.]MDD7504681.1 TetR family transcriptional regulator [Actinomycetaceae bacterium]MDY6143952.1 TetR family transcriptional regulator [Arcanobacterium sp.]
MNDNHAKRATFISHTATSAPHDAERHSADNTPASATSRGPAGARGAVRERLLSAARHQFTEYDFPTVTVRAIAKEAGCDAGLVGYYFGSKAGIFREAMSLPKDPVELILNAFGNGGIGSGERILLAIMKLWEESEANNNFRIFASSMLSSEAAMHVFRAWIDTNLSTPLIKRLHGANRRIRLEMGFAQVLGLVITRYIYGMEPLASMPKEQLAHVYGAHIDATLAGATGTPGS